jgi:hypothetical protein
MMLNDDGSMFGGHSARRKFGGPEIYAVARRALIAGEDEGNRYAKIWVVNEACAGWFLTLWSLRFWTKAQCCSILLETDIDSLYNSSTYLEILLDLVWCK